jgi:hypothetical protein
VTEGAADPRHVAARSVLLDALDALQPHDDALVVVGAQAVYLRTGAVDIGVAPFTTDGDLVLDPSLLTDEPGLEAAMENAGFELRPEPGTWFRSIDVGGNEFVVPVDLIVPDAVALGGGRRGARLGPHGNRAARKAVGLEAALVDRSPMEIGALDPEDRRTRVASVAGPAALLVAKAHKIHDRLTSTRVDRADDKDAADAYRIMQTHSAAGIAGRLADLRRDPVAGRVTDVALGYLIEYFGRRRAPGVAMASRALRLAIPEDQLTAVATAFVEQLRGELDR